MRDGDSNNLSDTASSQSSPSVIPPWHHRLTPRFGFAATAPGRAVYILSRFIFLCLTTTLLPMAVFFLRQPSALDPALPELPRTLALVLLPGGLLWALLYIGLEQFGFPKSLLGAIAAPIVLALNGFFGASLTQWSWSYAAYQVQLGSAAAQFGFLVFLSVYSVFTAAGREGFGRLGFVIATGAAIPLAPVLFFLSKYLILELRQESNPLLKWGSIGAFLLQVVFDLRLLYYASALNHGRGKKHAKGLQKDVHDGVDLEEANRLHEAWSGLTAIALVISTSAFVLGLIW